MSVCSRILGDHAKEPLEEASDESGHRLIIRTRDFGAALMDSTNSLNGQPLLSGVKPPKELETGISRSRLDVQVCITL